MSLWQRSAAGLARLAVFFAAIAVAAIASAAAPSGFVLELQFSNPRGGIAQLFFNAGDGYNARDVVTVTVPASTALEPVRFVLPAKPLIRLRLDPDTGEAEVRIGRMRLLTESGTPLKEFGPECLRPMQSIRSIALDQGIAVVRTGANDPMLIINEPLQAVSQQALGMRTVNRPTVLALALVAVSGLAFAAAAAFRALRSAAANPSGTALWFFGAALVVSGARLYWLARYGSPMPATDEWDADLLQLLTPMQGGFLSWDALFHPHAEHRIAITRLLTLGGTLLNGEWDPRLGMIAGVAMFSATIALLATAVLSAGGRIASVLAATILAFATLPFDHANLVWGFQNQMYAVTLTGVCILLIASAGRAGAPAPAAAVIACLLSLVTMGSGFVAPVVGLAIVSLRMANEHSQRRTLLRLAVVFAIAIAAGFLLRTDSRWHAPSYTHSVAEFGVALFRFASWPLQPGPLAMIVVWLPWAVHSAVLPFRRGATFVDWMAFGLGAWAAIHVAALAHGRPYEQVPLDSRFHTVLSMGVVSSLLCSFALLNALPRRKWLVAPLAGCSGLALATVLRLGGDGFGRAREQLERKQEHSRLVEHYLETGDRSTVLDVDFARSPYWNAADMSVRLDDPGVQPVLPAAFRAALARRASAAPVAVRPGALMRAAQIATAWGPAIILAGLGLLALSFRRRLADPNRQPADSLS